VTDQLLIVESCVIIMDPNIYYNSDLNSTQHLQPSNLNIGKGKHPFSKVPCIVITERSAFGLSKVYLEYAHIGLLLKTVTDIVVRDCGFLK